MFFPVLDWPPKSKKAKRCLFNSLLFLWISFYYFLFRLLNINLFVQVSGPVRMFLMTYSCFFFSSRLISYKSIKQKSSLYFLFISLFAFFVFLFINFYFDCLTYIYLCRLLISCDLWVVCHPVKIFILLKFVSFVTY
jgi:hypothetical protein